ncbi:hypothetical protein ACFL30_02985 [Candidatus Latescibacterota bacterium]
MTMNGRPDISAISAGSVVISHETALSVDSIGEGIITESPAGFAKQLLCLDAFLQGIITCERLYATSSIRVGYESSPLVKGRPELPVTVLYPWFVTDPDYPWDSIASSLLKDTSFTTIVEKSEIEDNELTKEYTNGSQLSVKDMMQLSAKIITGDLWRSMDLGTAFLANCFESSICLLEQMHSLQADMRLCTADTIAGLIQQTWDTTKGEAHVLKGLKFFSVSMPLFIVNVLRESSNRDDIWTVAMQMRETKEARAFCEWIKSIQQEDKPGNVASKSSEAHKLSYDLFRVCGSNQWDIRMGVGFPYSRSVTSSPRSGQLKREKIHIRFLRRFVGSAMKEARVETELTRLFRVPRNVADESIALLATVD